MKVSIYKTNGKMRGERLKVRVFSNSDLMHQFLNKQSDNDWKINTQQGTKESLPHKAGLYAYAGGQWHNVKSLDSSILAHI